MPAVHSRYVLPQRMPDPRSHYVLRQRTAEPRRCARAAARREPDDRSTRFANPPESNASPKRCDHLRTIRTAVDHRRSARLFRYALQRLRWFCQRPHVGGARGTHGKYHGPRPLAPRLESQRPTAHRCRPYLHEPQRAPSTEATGRLRPTAVHALRVRGLHSV